MKWNHAILAMLLGLATITANANPGVRQERREDRREGRQERREDRREHRQERRENRQERREDRREARQDRREDRRDRRQDRREDRRERISDAIGGANPAPRPGAPQVQPAEAPQTSPAPGAPEAGSESSN